MDKRIKPTTNILDLPQDCLSHILSLTSPSDVVRSSTVSKQFLSVSTRDGVWDKFLPPDLDDIVSKSSSLIPLASKKELFMHLCDFPVLLEDNTKSFALDKMSGKIRYMLGSRALSIFLGNDPQNWRWEQISESRFPECVVLTKLYVIALKGTIHTTLLSQGTVYGAYFVYQIENTYSPDTCFYIKNTLRASISIISKDGLPIIGNQHGIEIKHFYFEKPSLVKESNHEDIEEDNEVEETHEYPVIRGDGWLEIEMGRCQIGVSVNGGDEMLEMHLEDALYFSLRKDFVVHGIELRPLS